MNVQLLEQTAATVESVYAPIFADLECTKALFDAELASELPLVNAFCERLRAYRGKMLRPALLLLTGKACGRLTAEHHTLAAVVEMVHLATLVHDDVLDGADERRGRATVCATDGNVAAVLLGDCLISHAFHLCSSLDSQFASRRIGATTNTVCEGELWQNHLRGSDTLDEATYLEIVGRKTGALTAVACELGAHCAGAPMNIVGDTAAFGRSAGVAFQIIDDVLDLVGRSDAVGKTLGLDLALGKLTLPTIHALDHADPATASKLGDAIAGRRPVSVEMVRAWLESSGSIAYAQRVAAAHVHHALRRLESLAPGEAKDALTAMTKFIVDRQF